VIFTAVDVPIVDAAVGERYVPIPARQVVLVGAPLDFVAVTVRLPVASGRSRSRSCSHC
jgi:hypothetical protein